MSSPHQEVDNFVLTLVQKDGIQGGKCWFDQFWISGVWLYFGDSCSKIGGLLHCSVFVLNNEGLTSALTAIRRWNYFAAEQLLVYDIVKYRWCKNVQRFHKSNNIMYVVFTSWGFPFFMVCVVVVFFFKSVFLLWFLIFWRIIVDLKEEVWYQKCHDPECRNFRSSSKS